MKEILLTQEEILSGYDMVSKLYPFIPTMCMWRAWETAVYKKHKLSEPVLDIGCGDGRYFNLLWPELKRVEGVDINAGVLDVAFRSGMYSKVFVTPAHCLPVESESYSSVFANCSLEHMDNLIEVLYEIKRSLIPGGMFLCSVVVDKFIEWSTLPLLSRYLAGDKTAQRIQLDYIDYHHIVNPLSPHQWISTLNEAGFEVMEHFSIVPELTTRLFLFLDQLWHIKKENSELSESIEPYLMGLKNFPENFRSLIAAILAMESNWNVGSGAVFFSRRTE